jgi:hypothetical protein
MALSRLLADAVLRGEPSPHDDIARELARVLPAAAPSMAGARDRPGEHPVTAAGETVDADVHGAARAEAGAPPRRRARAPGTAIAIVVAAMAVAAAVQLARRPTAAPGSGVAASAVRAVAVAPPAVRPATPATAGPPATRPVPAAARSAAAPEGRRRTSELRILAPGSWVAVYVDGRKLGDDAGVFAIAPGRHQLRVENPPLRFVRSEAINLRDGETLTRSYDPSSTDAPPP